ncbi:27eec0de-f30a-43e4-8d7e-1573a495d450 [Sclerotinia trifoliorum]|uniref:27eec0de-f30a-43e4-8d7e-1573a495d450 n=1 Tax=Sclerotinia trifoliorum TaxID=28548 RepID=A0A8H2ZSW8_9HELO|nr:27eec0de-f30a-43e4-8d7e-1573a495d450 [Sclerotinia trifoliorum]
MLIRAIHILMMSSDTKGQCCSIQILQQVLHKRFYIATPRVVSLGSYGAFDSGFCGTALNLYPIYFFRPTLGSNAIVACLPITKSSSQATVFHLASIESLWPLRPATEHPHNAFYYAGEEEGQPHRHRNNLLRWCIVTCKTPYKEGKTPNFHRLSIESFADNLKTLQWLMRFFIYHSLNTAHTCIGYIFRIDEIEFTGTVSELRFGTFLVLEHLRAKARPVHLSRRESGTYLWGQFAASTVASAVALAMM